MDKKTLALIILDGFGITKEGDVSAIAAADTPNLDNLTDTCSHSKIYCSGLDVGLPDGQMGNSEVGHTNIGAGRIVYQELTRISKAIDDGDFFENPVLIRAMQNALENDKALHLYGLMSDGGVHSHNTHLWALIKMAKDMGLKKVFVHCFLDGRDVPPSSGADFVRECDEICMKSGIAKIATVMGRYYAMDRDNRWDRVQRAYDAMTLLKGERAADAYQSVLDSYKNEVTDEFMLPTVIDGAEPINDGDSIIFFNFRPDRAREITRAFVDKDFSGFKREKDLQDLFYVCFTQYDAQMPNVHVAFTPQSLENTLGEYLSKLGLTQLRIAETEKYAHVTFFFNGGVETVYDGEDRCLIPSPQVATYDLQPEMSAYLVAGEMVKRIESGAYDVIILNFANCDMVGHTGIFDAAKAACEAVDKCIGLIVDAIKARGGIALITADHGNSDKMLDDDGATPFTAHTVNPVPLILVGSDKKLRDGRLADLAPTILDLMAIDIPKEMTGKSLLI